MPIISSFFGIYVCMYFADHAPAHIDVECQGHQALVATADRTIIRGELPKRAHALVRQRCLDHRAALEQNWASAQALRPLSRIPGRRQSAMIKLTAFEPKGGYGLLLRFSNGALGVCDFAAFVDAGTEMTVPLREPEFFARYFIELGKKGNKNGVRFI